MHKCLEQMFLCSSQKLEKQMSFENEWIRKFRNIHTMSYCPIMKRDKLVIQAKTLGEPQLCGVGEARQERGHTT